MNSRPPYCGAKIMIPAVAMLVSQTDPVEVEPLLV